MSKTSSGPHPLLVKYLSELAAHPLRTKAITTGTLCFLQEVLGSNIAGLPVKRPTKDAPFFYHALAQAHIDTKAIKMALYGFLVSAPLGHVLVGVLQKVFAGRTGLGARVAQILASNLFIAPIQTTAFLTSMAVINGAQTVDEVLKTLKAGFFSVIRITWVVSPLSMAIAQKYVPPHLWVPFFNAIQFVLGTVFNARMKSLRMAQLKKEREEEEKKGQQ
ncbi:hypothetical protein K435DRAFT_959713 [Dendrothele bispora CBS 962.96]|uniref:Integral membrane protein n=1 Tax=Dendrothele bispora (strain CBS 962.96) TaxID=1314807 RepID=A0A4V4HIR9_DENBC|nr:hypothetical protein K435DRAFT_959713 [Dendrothele bispora CBS 962.96]